MKRHLIVNLEAPLMAFGGEAIDNYSVIRRFPSASMLTGIFANALGWRRAERERHQRLQDRLVFAVRIEREPAGGLSMRDFQTAQLSANDKGWTTRGQPEGRAGGAATYNSPHLRYRDYFADMRAAAALRLEPADEYPALDDLADALREPERPLFIGRKPCLPSVPLFGCFSDGETALDALMATPIKADGASENVNLFWPDGEGADGVESNRHYMITDQRNWRSGLHGGGRWVCEGSASKTQFAAAQPEAANRNDGEGE